MRRRFRREVKTPSRFFIPQGHTRQVFRRPPFPGDRSSLLVDIQGFGKLAALTLGFAQRDSYFKECGLNNCLVTEEQIL